MKKILITGGAGFIGSHLSRKLIDEGNEIYCLDNFFTGTDRNISSMMPEKNFNLIRHNIIDPLDINIKIDEIYNLACPASPVHYQYDPIFTFMTSIWGAYNMLELAKKNNSKILQASTSEVYGDPSIHPQDESYWGNVNPIGIRSCYDEGKRGAETLFFDYWRKFKINIKVVRIFNTYGPNMHPQDGRVVSNFIVQALKGDDITVYGDGTQTRSFCYVDDLVNGLIEMMNSEDEITGPINLGNPEEFSMNQLAEKVIEFTNSKSKIIYNALPQDDPKLRKPDISLANRKLNWSPIIDLNTGLKKTMEYFSKIYLDK